MDSQHHAPFFLSFCIRTEQYQSVLDYLLNSHANIQVLWKGPVIKTSAFQASVPTGKCRFFSVSRHSRDGSPDIMNIFCFVCCQVMFDPGQQKGEGPFSWDRSFSVFLKRFRKKKSSFTLFSLKVK